MTSKDATEIAYRNGYSAGYEQGKKDATREGYWIEIDPISCSYACSNCLGTEVGIPPNYCPHCGQRNVGVEPWE